ARRPPRRTNPAAENASDAERSERDPSRVSDPARDAPRSLLDLRILIHVRSTRLPDFGDLRIESPKTARLQERRHGLVVDLRWTLVAVGASHADPVFPCSVAAFAAEIAGLVHDEQRRPGFAKLVLPASVEDDSVDRRDDDADAEAEDQACRFLPRKC